MEVYIVILIAIALTVRFYITKKAAEKLRQREETFLVPKEGGVLQKMMKD
jgi:hypothetical protein